MTTISGVNITASTGNLLYVAPSGTNWSALPPGTTGQVLLSNGTTPTWTTLSGGIQSITAAGVVTLNQNLGVSNKTSAYTILTTDSGTIFTNAGASGSVVLTLPAAISGNIGLTYSFVVAAAQQLQVVTATPASENIFSNSANLTVSGAHISLTGTGSSQYGVCRITLIASSTWIVTSVIGPWVIS